MFLIGLTGGIGSGKSSISNSLRQSNIAVIDSDLIARQVVQPHSKCWRLIVQHFGQEVLQDDQQINRVYLAQVIFNDPQKRQLLNSITHPEVQKRTVLQLLYYYFTFHSLVVLDIPLLYESSVIKSYLSYIIVVNCTKEQQLQRIKRRNGYSDQEALQRIEAQIPLEEKCSKADFVIDNTKNLEHALEQCEAIFRNIKFPLSFWITRLMLIAIYSTLTAFVWQWMVSFI